MGKTSTIRGIQRNNRNTKVQQKINANIHRNELFDNSCNIPEYRTIFLCFVDIFVCFCFDWNFNTMSTVFIFLHFYLLCLFVLFTHCCQYNETYGTVIQVRGKASFKTRFNPPFFTLENACHKLWIWQSLSIRLMCLNFCFCYLMRNFPFRIFSRSSVFFICFTCNLSKDSAVGRFIQEFITLRIVSNYVMAWSIMIQSFAVYKKWTDNSKY